MQMAGDAVGTESFLGEMSLSVGRVRRRRSPGLLDRAGAQVGPAEAWASTY